MNKNDELVRVRLNLSFKDASGEALSDASSGTAPNGQMFKIREWTQAESW